MEIEIRTTVISGRSEFTGKGHEGTSQSDDNVQHFDLAEIT